MTDVDPHDVSLDRVEAALERIGASPAVDTSHHSLSIFDSGGQPRSAYRELSLGSFGELLHVGSPLPFPLSLVPSHRALIAIRVPSSLASAVELLQSQGLTSVIYAPRPFQDAFRARLVSTARRFSVRSRVAAGEYRDLLESFGDDYFDLEMYFDYDPPLVGYRLGAALSPVLGEILEALAG